MKLIAILLAIPIFSYIALSAVTQLLLKEIYIRKNQKIDKWYKQEIDKIDRDLAKEIGDINDRS